MASIHLCRQTCTFYSLKLRPARPVAVPHSNHGNTDLYTLNSKYIRIIEVYPRLVRRSSDRVWHYYYYIGGRINFTISIYGRITHRTPAVYDDKYMLRANLPDDDYLNCSIYLYTDGRRAQFHVFDRTPYSI